MRMNLVGSGNYYILYQVPDEEPNQWCTFVYWFLSAVEISDEEAEKIFSCKDAVELLKSKLDIH